MKKIKHLAKLYVNDAGGATAIEYGLIAASMALMLIPVMTSLTSVVKSSMYDVMAGLF
jgi:Flp pilus assembly pilin Flp